MNDTGCVASGATRLVNQGETRREGKRKIPHAVPCARELLNLSVQVDTLVVSFVFPAETRHDSPDQFRDSHKEVLAQ